MPSYRIEVFSASSMISDSGSKFGQSEVQTVTLVTDGEVEGTFTLAFGDLNYPLPGTVDVVFGEDYIVTSEDLTPYVKRGDRVAFDGGWEYAVHAFMPFNASHLYLAQVRRLSCAVWLSCAVRLVLSPSGDTPNQSFVSKPSQKGADLVPTSCVLLCGTLSRTSLPNYLPPAPQRRGISGFGHATATTRFKPMLLRRT